MALAAGSFVIALIAPEIIAADTIAAKPVNMLDYTAAHRLTIGVTDDGDTGTKPGNTRPPIPDSMPINVSAEKRNADSVDLKFENSGRDEGIAHIIVPEPDIFALLLVGLGLVGASSWERKRNAFLEKRRNLFS